MLAKRTEDGKLDLTKGVEIFKAHGETYVCVEAEHASSHDRHVFKLRDGTGPVLCCSIHDYGATGEVRWQAERISEHSSAMDNLAVRFFRLSAYNEQFDFSKLLDERLTRDQLLEKEKIALECLRSGSAVTVDFFKADRLQNDIRGGMYALVTNGLAVKTGSVNGNDFYEVTERGRMLLKHGKTRAY